MSKDIMLFDFNDRLVRVRMDESGNPWWIAKDVCDVLGLEHITNTLSKLDDDEKLTVKILQSGQNRDMWVINESGLYTLVLRSNKPEAKAFRKWITSEVLPSIRKKGGYSVESMVSEVPAVLSKRKLREQAINLYLMGNTLEQIAEKTGVTYSTLNRWKKQDAGNELTDWDAVVRIIDMPLPVLARVYAFSIKKCIYDMQKNTDELKDARVADAITKHIAILRQLDPKALGILNQEDV